MHPFTINSEAASKAEQNAAPLPLSDQYCGTSGGSEPALARLALALFSLLNERGGYLEIVAHQRT